jgi:hypothetical protein
LIRAAAHPGGDHPRYEFGIPFNIRNEIEQLVRRVFQTRSVGIRHHDLLSFLKVPISFLPLPLAIHRRLQRWLQIRRRPG